MPALESKIGDLYSLPLDEFTAARDRLASDLKGAERATVKQLKKPTTVPWAVNQVYWHARAIFDRVLQRGSGLRRVQVAALEGRPADVRAASDAHRSAVAAAVARAVEIAAAAGIHPDRDALTRTFEALSLGGGADHTPGRLTAALRPGGFEMLAGVKPIGPPKGPPDGPPKGGRHVLKPAAPGPDARAEEAKRRLEAEVATAERAVQEARAKLAGAQKAADLAAEGLIAAERHLEAVRSRRSG